MKNTDVGLLSSGSQVRILLGAPLKIQGPETMSQVLFSYMQELVVVIMTAFAVSTFSAAAMSFLAVPALLMLRSVVLSLPIDDQHTSAVRRHLKALFAHEKKRLAGYGSTDQF